MRLERNLEVSCFHSLRVFSNRTQHAHMCVAPAEHAGHGLLDLRVAGFWISIEERFGREDDAVHAEPALHGLFINKRLLNRMRFFDGSEPLERRDFRSSRVLTGVTHDRTA